MELSHSCEFQFPVPTHLQLEVTSGKVAISLLTGLYSEADAPQRYFGAACPAWLPSKNAINGRKVAPVPLPALGDSGSWEWHCPAKIPVLCWALVAFHRWHPTAIKCSTGFSAPNPGWDHWTPRAAGLGKVRQGLGMANVYPATVMAISFPTKQERMWWVPSPCQGDQLQSYSLMPRVEYSSLGCNWVESP